MSAAKTSGPVRQGQGFANCRRSRLPCTAAVPEPAPQVVGAEYRIVDQQHERDHQAAEHHQVHGSAEQIHDEHGQPERKRNGDGAEQGGAPVEEKRHENQDDQNGRDHHDQGEVVDRFLDVSGRTVERRIDLDAAKSGSHRRQRFLHAARNFERAAVGPLFDHQQESGTVLEYRIADQRLMVFDHRSDVTEAQLRALLERDLGQVGGAGDRRNVLDADPLVRRVDEAAGAGHRGFDEAQRRSPKRVGSRFDDLQQRDAMGLQSLQDRRGPEAAARADPRSRRWRRPVRP